MQKSEKTIINLHSLVNCSSRNPRTINREKKASKFSDKTDTSPISSTLSQIQNNNICTQFNNYQKQDREQYQQKQTYHKSRNRFYNQDKYEQRYEQGQREQNVKEYYDYTKQSYDQNTPPSQYQILDFVKQRLNFKEFRINQQMYQDICDKLEQSKKQDTDQSLDAAGISKEDMQQQEIKQLGLVMDEEDLGSLEDYNLVFIRHAYSKINYYYDRYRELLQNKKQKQHFRLRLFKENNSFIDSELHDYGVMQCQMKIQKMNKIAFHSIYVSPMARAIQTCTELFKNHPMKDKINFYIHSNLGEMLKKDSDIFDYQKFICQIDDAQIQGIKFNTTKFFSPNWQEKLICDQFYLKNASLDPLFIKQMLYEVFPLPLEDFYKFKQRSLKALKEIQTQECEKNEIIGIVSHSLVQLNMFDQLKISVPHEIGNLQLYYYKQ